MARGNDRSGSTSDFDSSCVTRSVLGAGISTTAQAGDWIIVPAEVLDGIKWQRIVTQIIFVICFGAGVGATAPVVWAILNMMLGSACTAYAAFNF